MLVSKWKYLYMWEPQFRSMSTFSQGLRSHRDTAHFHGKPWNPSSRSPATGGDWRGFRSTHFGRENGIINGQLHRSTANRWIYVYITYEIWSIMLYMMCSILHILYRVYDYRLPDITIYGHHLKRGCDNWLGTGSKPRSRYLCGVVWFHVGLGLLSLSVYG